MNPETLLILFVCASLLAVVANRVRIPYVVALVLGGLLLGSLKLFQAPVLSQDLLFNVVLPGLIFESAYHLPASALWRDRLAIFGLAVPGVLLSIVLTAAVFVWSSHFLGDLEGVVMPFGIALVFGAMVAATDPISVVAIFRQLQAPARLTLLVESESLLNDGTAIVFFTLFLGIAMGSSAHWTSLATSFLEIVGGGILVGGFIGWLAAEWIKRVDDAMVEITLTILAAYGSFLAADQLGYSGVISTVAAGLVCGATGIRQGMAPSVSLAVNTFWEYLGFVLNSLVFLLVGFTIHLPELFRVWPLILAAYVAITLARASVVYGVGALLSKTRSHIPWIWHFILLWGGVRGALSMVLVLSLPPHFPYREILVNLVFGVVLLTILIQGLTMTPIAKSLGIIDPNDRWSVLEARRMRLRLAQGTLDDLERLRREEFYSEEAVELIRKHFVAIQESSRASLGNLDFDPAKRLQGDFTRLYQRLLARQKKRLLDAQQAGLISQRTFDELRADLDAETLDLESQPRALRERWLEELRSQESETGGPAAAQPPESGTDPSAE